MCFVDIKTEVFGGLFERGILILRHEAAPKNHFKQLKSVKNDNGRYSSRSRPMTAISGVLKSP